MERGCKWSRQSHQAHEHRSLQEHVQLLLRDPRYSCHNPSLNCSGAKGWQRPGKVSSKMGSAEVTYKTWSGRAGYRKLQIHEPPFLLPLLCIHLKEDKNLKILQQPIRLLLLNQKQPICCLGSTLKNISNPYNKPAGGK